MRELKLQCDASVLHLYARSLWRNECLEAAALISLFPSSDSWWSTTPWIYLWKTENVSSERFSGNVKLGTCTFQTCTHLQWVATHSLLQYSLSQSSHSMAGLLQPALAHTLLIAEASLDPFTSISSWKKKLAQIWVSLISVMGIFCILMKACHIRWSCYTSLSFRMRLYDTVKAKVRMKTIQPLGIVSGLTTWNQLV